MGVALTVQDVEKLQAVSLKLVHRKLQALPHGLAKLTRLTTVDASDNPIIGITASELPPNLIELDLVGCQLVAVPQCLTSLTSLQHLQLSANQISDANAVFQIPYLLHAGLGYNCISNLQICSNMPAAQRHYSQTERQHTSGASPNRNKHSGKQLTQTRNSSSTTSCCSSFASMDVTAVPQHITLSKPHPNSSTINQSCTQTTAALMSPGTPSSKASAPTCSCSSALMSLDLSHNNISDLLKVLQQLQQLSQLRSLSLRGNPVSLLPCYQEAVLQHLPQLLYLDGQKLDGIITTSKSRPGSAATSGQRPSSALSRPYSARTAAKQQLQQQFPTGACSSTIRASELAAVPILLELNRLQVVEPAAQVFAGLSELSVRKQQDLQLQRQQEEMAAAEVSVPEAKAPSVAGGGHNQNKARSSSGGDAAGSTRTGADALGAAAGTATTAAAYSTQMAPAPLKPLSYHLQLTTPDGSDVCSTALTIQPPAVAPDKAALAAEAEAAAAAAAAAGKKGKGGKPAKADSKPATTAGLVKGKAGTKGAKGARSSIDEGAAVAASSATQQQQMVQGCFRAMLQLPVTVAGRDWLRTGFTVQLIRTHFEPDMLLTQQQPTAQPVAAASSAAAAAGGSKCAGSGSGKGAVGSKQAGAAGTAVTDDLVSPQWQYSMQQQVLGTARISTASILDSSGWPDEQVSEGAADFLPAAPLFSPTTGTLMLLKEASAKLQSVGSCRWKLVLQHSSEQRHAAAQDVPV